MIFLGGEIVSYLVYLGQGEDFKLTTELSEKVQYPHNQLYVQDKILCVSSNKDLIL